MSREHARVLWRGKPMTARQRQALIAAERAIRKRYWTFRWIVFQGSWQAETSYSGTSHTGAGVVDLGWSGMKWAGPLSKAKYKYALKQLRDVGRQAGFGRGPWCEMPLHFHVCDLDTEGEASTVSTFQVPQYRAGCDGLTAGHPDPFKYRPPIIRKWRYHA